MMKTRFIGTLIVLVHLVAQSMPAQAAGQSKSPGRELDCLVASDFYIVHLTAFQNPKNDASARSMRGAFESFCQDIPATGPTYLSLDLLDRDARALPVEILVVEQARSMESDEWVDLETIARVAPAVYRNGVAEVAVDFKQAGDYAVKLRVGDDMFADEIRIPLRVAVGWSFDIRMLTPLLLPVVLGAIAFLLVRLSGAGARRRAAAAPLLERTGTPVQE